MRDILWCQWSYKKAQKGKCPMCIQFVVFHIPSQFFFKFCWRLTIWVALIMKFIIQVIKFAFVTGKICLLWLKSSFQYPVPLLSPTTLFVSISHLTGLLFCPPSFFFITMWLVSMVQRQCHAGCQSTVISWAASRTDKRQWFAERLTVCLFPFCSEGPSSA